MVGRETTAKRKKTVEMPDSPPKRVTRARAAKVADDTESKPRVTKITTASAKAAASKKKAAAPGKPAVSKASSSTATKRKMNSDEEDKTHAPETSKGSETAQQKEEEPPKPRARQKRTAAPAKATAELEEAPKPRGKQAATSKIEDAPKTRGRPKKVADKEGLGANEQVQEIASSVPARKTTRGRAAASSKIAAVVPSLASMPRKKVQFQEEPDKENVPVEIAGPKKSAMKATGLRAKPVRKPAAPRPTTRGRKALNDIPQKEEDKTTESRPLSPKKGFQLANVGSTSSEDELAGEKTPIRSLSQSPSKIRVSPVKNISSVAKLDFSQVAVPSSPSKTMASSAMGSPARRPPQSPFKDSLKTSPKKLNLGERIAQPAFPSSKTPIPLQKSLLQESPKKGKIGDSTLHAITLPAQTPHKASLLQSSPRRLMVSPSKADNSASPNKSGNITNTLGNSPMKAPRLFAHNIISSPMRSNQVAEPAEIANTTTEEERQQESSDQEVETELPASPVAQVAIAPSSEEAKLETDQEQLAIDAAKVKSAEEDLSIESPSPVKSTALFKAPIFAIPSSNLRRVSVESQSDDELASPDRKYAPTPLRKHAFAQDHCATPSQADKESGLSEGVPMSSLADRLSTWAASSPDKQAPAGRSRQTRGMFSIGGLETLTLPEQEVFDIVVESPNKVSFFEDQMAVTSQQDDQSVTVLSVDNEATCLAPEASQESLASDEYGDENAIPSDAEILRAEQDEHTLTCTPAKVFTPVKLISQRPHEVHTVSKVPLRAPAEDSPVRVQRQRSKSFGGPLAAVDRPVTNLHGQRDAVKDVTSVDVDQSTLLAPPATPSLTATNMPQTPSSVMRLDTVTPGRTVRKGKNCEVLKGAVVYVDVHTTEGADASGIFVDLLTQMGARCVKQWNWNPRDGLDDSPDSGSSPHTDSPQSSAATAKIGITHIVYKDGGKRTLEKVRASNGVVLCVGVGWVLE